MELVRCEVLIVGGGVIGLALSKVLAEAGRDVALIERASRFGTETSSRHSEVIHAGIYYPTGSLKAETCVEGRRLLYDYLERRGVPYQKISKLIFASTRAQVEDLERLYQRGLNNGVEGLHLVGGGELKRLEPGLRAERAILSEETGIFDSHLFLKMLAGDAQAAGAMLALETEFESALRNEPFWDVTAKSGAGAFSIKTRWLINCAGHAAHRVARGIASYPLTSLPSRYLARGSYWSTTQRVPFQRLLYPMPSEAGLGIHLTFDLAGAARFGPDVEWVNDEDYGVDSSRKEHFVEAIQAYFPELQPKLLEPAYAGIRPKIVGPSEAAADFCMQTSEQHGAPNLIHFFGIESPGLTASLALADRVNALLP